MPSDRISATRRIAAPASAIFAVVSNPTGHVAIDGSGMLEAAPDARPITAEGETFLMDMDRAPLGDVPGMGKYQVRNLVTRIVPDRLIEWGPGTVDRPLFGHLYGWEIEPVADGECDVTNYCDWSGIPDKMRQAREWPVVPLAMLEQSVENLDRAVSGR